MNKIKAFIKENKVPLILAVGLLLFIAHYPDHVLQYVPLFQIGAFILWFTVAFLISNRWKQFKQIGLGPKYIWIPLAVISGSAVLRIIVYHKDASIAGALFMASMFGLYLVSRQYGEKTLSLFMPVAIIGAVSIIIQAFITRTSGNSGLFNNYATACEFIIFGWLVSPHKHQWWMSAIIVTALFATGAGEAPFYVLALGIVILARKDWSKKLLLPVGVLAGILLISVPLGIAQNVYSTPLRMLNAGYVALTNQSLTTEERDILLNEALDQRWLYGWRIQRPIMPLGYGMDITNMGVLEGRHTPHNIILLVTDQLGPVAMIAWFAMIIGGIRKTKWKYGYLSLLLFGVFQPFVWTEMAPYSWVLNGAATSSKIDTSYIFREVVATM